MTTTARHSPAEAFFAWRPAGVGAVFVPCGWCAAEGAGTAVRLSENLLEALCPACANSLALGRARAVARKEGPEALWDHLRGLGLVGSVFAAAEGDLLDRLIDSGCLRRDLRLTIELDSSAGTHAYSAAPLREVVLPEEVRAAFAERRRAGGVLSELLCRRLRERLATTIRSVGPDAGLECFRGEGASPGLLPERAQALLRALPLRRTPSGALVVAVWDPLDGALAQDLERLVEGPVQLVLADPEALERALPRAVEVGESAAEPRPGPAPALTWLGGESGEDPLLEVLLEALEEGASELHLEPREGDAASLRFRVGGELRDARPVPAEVLLAFAESLAPREGLQVVSSGRARYEVPGLPLTLEYRRVETPLGPSLAFTLEEPGEGPPLGLGQLGLSFDALARFEAVVAAGQGLVVIGAPGARERSSAYYAVLERAARLGGSVLSLEGHVRRLLPLTQLHVEPGLSLAGLCAPRPDWVGIDGALTPETLRLALDVVLAGSAAVITVPAVDARTALLRLQLEGVPQELLDRTVEAVLARRVVSTLCPHCRFRLDEAWVGLGCAACAEQGRGPDLPLAELVRSEGGELVHCSGSVSLVERWRSMVAEGTALRGVSEVEASVRNR